MGNPHEFPTGHGVFETVEAELTKGDCVSARVNRRSPWEFTFDRPGLVIGGIPVMASGSSTPAVERRVIVRSDGTYRGYCLPNGRSDAFFAEAKAAAIEQDLDFIGLSSAEKRMLAPAFKYEQLTSYSIIGKKAAATIKRASASPLLRPRFSACLPLPSDKTDWRCIASGPTWQALLGLNKTYGTPRSPLALVTGPPGSGKEAYARAVHYGQEGKRNALLPTYSLAEYSNWSKLVKDLKRDLAAIIKVAPRGSAVFFDEVDKADDHIRSSLLRLLETRTLGTLRCKDVTFVCAAGKTLPQLRECNPPDFWTRMEVHVPIQDPLRAGTQDERSEIVSALFRHFWWDLWSDWAERVVMASCAPKSKESVHDVLVRVRQANSFARTLFESCIGTWRKRAFEMSKPVMYVSKYFATVLAPHLERRELSVRGLRSATAAVIHGCRPALLAWGLYGDSKPAKFIEQAERSVHDAVGTIIQVLPS